MGHFRFEDLRVWQEARDLAVAMHTIGESLEARRLYRYAEQVRAAGLSVPNNIAEGAGSTHEAEFRQFLNIARRSIFETASMLLVFHRLGVLDTADLPVLFERYDALSRQILTLSRERSKRTE